MYLLDHPLTSSVAAHAVADAERAYAEAAGLPYLVAAPEPLSPIELLALLLREPA